MQKFTQDHLAPKVSVALFATHTLVNTSLQLLIENHANQVAVLAHAISEEDLFKIISSQKPNIVLLCVEDQGSKALELIPKIKKAYSETKVILLAGPNVLKSPSDAQKIGAVGIVGLNQGINVLMHAIEQVSQGKTWLNQKLVLKIFEKNSDHENGIQNNTSSDILTKRELEVVSMIGKGMNNKQIAKRMFISETTVRHHLSSIYAKLNVNDRLNLVIHAYQNGILHVPDEVH